MLSGDFSRRDRILVDKKKACDLRYLLPFIVVLCAFSSKVHATEILAPEYRGGKPAPNEGLLTIMLVPSRSLAKKDAGTSVIKFIHEPTKRVYKIEFDLGIDFRKAPKRWRLPRGNYRINQLVVNTQVGLFQFRGPHPKALSIKAGELFNAGRWVVVERKNRRLEILPKPLKPKAQNPPAASMVGPRSKLPSTRRSEIKRRSGPTVGTALDNDTVISGRGPNRRSMLGQLGLPSSGAEREGEARISYTVTQTISMLYKIDLNRHNSYARYVQAGINRIDKDLRQCYGDRLGINENLKGTMHFKFIYSKVEKSFRSIKTVEDTTGDPRFVECVYWLLGDAEFQIGTDLIGDITFYFNIK